MKCPECGGDTSVLETRPDREGLVTRRRHRCGTCGKTFGSVQVYDEIWPTIKRWALDGNGRAVLKRRALYRRNAEILKRVAAGEKHASIASDFQLSDNMISTIAARAGMPGRLRRQPNPEASS